MDKNITNNRIFFILSLGILLLSILGIFSNYLFQRLSIQNNADYYAQKYVDDFNKNMESEANSFSNLLHIIDEKNLQENYLSSNREKLYKSVLPLFENMKKYNDLTHFYFIKPNGEVFLRIHNYTNHSDIINRNTFLKAKALQKDYYGLEFGILNTFTLRYVHPWIVNNEIIGYIELGKEIDKIADSLSEKMDLEIFFVIDKKEFNTTVKTDKNYVIYKTTNTNEAITNFINSNKISQTISFDNKNYVGFKYPLSDVSGKNLGFKVILVNLTNEYNELNKQSVYYSLIMTLGTIFMLFVGYLFSQSKQKQINQAINKLELSKTEIESLVTQQQDLLQLFNMGDSILFKWKNNKEWSVSYVSNNVQNLLGYSREDFLNEKIKYTSCIFPEDLNTVIKEVKNGSITTKDYFKHTPYRIINKKGEIRWVLDYTIFSKDANGNVTHFLGYIVDITEQKMIHENLKKLIDLQNNIIILTDGIELNYANKQFFNFFKFFNLEEFKEEHKCICEFFIEDDRYFNLSKIDKTQNWIEEIQKLPENKSIVAMENKNSIIHIFSVHINNFEKDLCIISFTDISETMIEQQKLEEKVNLDKLTNAFNREYFDNNIENILIENYKNHLETAFVMFDVDFFKKINDTYGHDVGDEVLKDFVNVLKLNSRFHYDVLIRWGGEEFLMIVSIKNKNTLLNVLEKYRDAIEKHNFELVKKITCSIGASIHNNNKTIKDTIKESDLALYEAKTSGRNKAILF